MSAGPGSSAVAPRRHVVRFYDHDDELADDVGSHLRRALAAGEAVIVVAGSAHRRAFEERMAGCRVRPRGGAGCWPSHQPGRRADHGSFHDPRSARSRPFRAGHRRGDPAGGWGWRPVHVYGEMVAQLWDAGPVSAALELESRWNELGERLPFSLTCGYPSQAVTGDEHAEALEAVCRLHAAVGGPEEAARSFPMAYGSPRAARHFVVQALRQWGAGSALRRCRADRRGTRRQRGGPCPLRFHDRRVPFGGWYPDLSQR